MNIFEAIILGIVQGLTEFLPISSSGHLAVLSQLFGIESNVLMFSIAVHLGTLLAVLIVFRKSVLYLIKNPFSHQAMMLYLATIPTLIFALLFKIFLPSVLDVAFVPYYFLFTAIVLVVTEFTLRKNKKKKLTENSISLQGGKEHVEQTVSTKSAIVIGIAQGIAVIPGISRSGSTICTGLLMGESREDTAHFSFLLSIIIIVVSFVSELAFEGGTFDAAFLLPAFIGIVSAFISGLVAIKFMLKIIKKVNLSFFAIYLVILAVLLLVF